MAKCDRIMPGVRKRGNIYHLEKTVNGVKIRKSLDTDDPEEAKAIAIAHIKRYGAQHIDDEWRDFVQGQAAQKGDVWIKNSFYRIRKSKRGCTLSFQDFVRLVIESNGRCQLTGIRFRYDQIGKERRLAPYSPSIDRIDPSKGYVHGNVRIVCLVVNIALGAWGEEVLRTIGKAFLLNELKSELGE